MEYNKKIIVNYATAVAKINNFRFGFKKLSSRRFYARLIIEKDVLRTENANKARMIGDIFKTEIPLVRIEETTTPTIPTINLTTVLTETQQQIIRLIKENNKFTIS